MNKEYANELSKFIQEFENKSNEELVEIVRNHSDYRNTAVEAAITLLEQRNKISLEDKEKFLTKLRNLNSPEEDKKSSSGNPGLGIILLIIGIIISVVSFQTAAPGETYIVTIGLIVVGIKMIFSN